MAQQSHELPNNAGLSVPVDMRRYVPHEYAGAGRGWVPVNPKPLVERIAPGKAPRPQTEVYSDTNIPDPFMPGEITPAKEIEWAWWTEITENAFPDEKPQDWGDSSWGNGHWDADNRPELQVDGQNPARYATTSAFAQEIEQAESEGLIPAVEDLGHTNGRAPRDYSQKETQKLYLEQGISRMRPGRQRK